MYEMIWKRQELVNAECDKWARKGINIMSEIRDNRIGYKAGALKAGMMHNYVKQCEFVAIFDADFQPDPDFLERTIPFLIHNHEISLVQCRWKFGKIIKSFGNLMVIMLSQILMEGMCHICSECE